MDDEKQVIDINKPDQAHAGKIEELIKNRKKVLGIADWIVPGHGKILRI